MVRKQNRKEDLRDEATHFYKNDLGSFYGKEVSGDFFVLTPECIYKWVRIPKWAFKKYFGDSNEDFKKDKKDCSQPQGL